MFTVDLKTIDWTATGVLITLIVILLRTLFGIRRNDIKTLTQIFSSGISEVTMSLTKIGTKLERFENRLLKLEEWRTVVDAQLHQNASLHKEISTTLTQLLESIARLEEASELTARARDHKRRR